MAEERKPPQPERTEIDEHEQEEKNEINPKHEKWALTINDTFRTINVNAINYAFRYVLAIWIKINISPENPDSEESIQTYQYQPILLGLFLFYVLTASIIRSRKAEEDTDLIMTTTTPPVHTEEPGILGDAGGMPRAIANQLNPVAVGTESAIVGFFKWSTLASSICGSMDFTTKVLLICHASRSYASMIGVSAWALTCLRSEAHRWKAIGSNPKHPIYKPLILLRRNQFRNKKDLALYWLVYGVYPFSTFSFQCRAIDILFMTFAGIFVKAEAGDKPSSTFQGGIQELPTLLFIGMLSLWFIGANRTLSPKLKAYFKPNTPRPIDWPNLFASIFTGGILTSWAAYSLTQSDNKIPLNYNLSTVYGISVPLGVVGILGTYIEHYKAPSLNANGTYQALPNPPSTPRTTSGRSRTTSPIKLSKSPTEKTPIFTQAETSTTETEQQIEKSSSSSMLGIDNVSFFKSPKLKIRVIDNENASWLLPGVNFFPKMKTSNCIESRQVTKEPNDRKQFITGTTITI